MTYKLSLTQFWCLYLIKKNLKIIPLFCTFLVMLSSSTTSSCSVFIGEAGMLYKFFLFFFLLPFVAGLVFGTKRGEIVTRITKESTDKLLKRSRVEPFRFPVSKFHYFHIKVGSKIITIKISTVSKTSLLFLFFSSWPTSLLIYLFSSGFLSIQQLRRAL